ncbi:hypothetical protein H0H81_008224 [Sphagnurus paluster]|uniref:Cytochrome P450 n=1 Tax=Sphagnurus paluster TaxID=117069 RepID=A0A9P7K4Z0_9AGAR|nr:hypothetical protein H0H81_008224 [Sphagnurus paluster]
MAFLTISLYAVIGLTIAANAIYLYINSKKRPAPLPPGPRPEPFIGNLRSIPPTDHHIFFYELGDVSYVNILGQSMVILNSVEAAVDLMEKRSSNYSDRAPMPVFIRAGWTKTLSMMRYGKEFQLHRRIFQKHFDKSKISKYESIQLAEARILAQNLLTDPDEKKYLIARFTTSIITSITYGHRIISDEDRYVLLGDEIGKSSAEAGSTSGALLDFQFQGSAKPCLVTSELEALEDKNVNSTVTLDDIKGAAAQTYAGGAETTTSSLSAFIMAIILHPEYQAQAQAELDAVVGTQRLPEFNDRDSLPFLQCLIDETLRWFSPFPAGIPHLSMEDDVYKGMFIPKGSTIIANARGMSWDEKVYANPFNFEPTRYLPAPLGRGEPRPVAHWGFGRRICPGRHFADSSLWIAIATILSTLSLSKALDKDGNEITPEPTETIPILYEASVGRSYQTALSSGHRR